MNVKGTLLRSGSATQLKRKISKTYNFLLPTNLLYQNLFCGTLICPLLFWQIGLNWNVSVEQVKALLMLFGDQQA